MNIHSTLMFFFFSFFFIYCFFSLIQKQKNLFQCLNKVLQHDSLFIKWLKKRKNKKKNEKQKTKIMYVWRTHGSLHIDPVAECVNQHKISMLHIYTLINSRVVRINYFTTENVHVFAIFAQTLSHIDYYSFLFLFRFSFSFFTLKSRKHRVTKKPVVKQILFIAF